MPHDSFSPAAFALVFVLVAACGDNPRGGGTDGSGGATGDAGAGASGGGTNAGGANAGGASNLGGGGSNLGGGDVGGGGSDPGPPPDLCTGYADVVMFAELPYNDYTRRTTASYGGFPPDRVFVLPMTLATTPASYSSPGNTSMAEYQGPPTTRHMTISRSPCDFRAVDPTGMNGPLAEGGGTAPLIEWNVGAAPLALAPGETYFFNYRNINCAQSSCDASTSTNWPH